ncbi:transcription factor bHLH113 [Citrus sinensis]|uniref:Transcription factor bHLH113 n=1 Tax=Citrus sinensis TaxID=2711 RepID=A0ACB8IE76_CITSI|nr:transcription factor bHLH113 [Citrus sinensis]
MADNGGFDGEQGSTTSFSQLLFSDDVVLGLDFNNYTCSSVFSANEKPPKMLCFGDYNKQNDGDIVVYGETTATAAATPKSGITCSDSSSASSGNNSSANTPSKSTKKRNGSAQESVPRSNLATTTSPVVSQRTSKKTKAADNPSSTAHAKAKKEKLGDRITALQQLVSPFGKTDTASVLHEAMGYIRFLHDQVQEGGENGGEESRKDLKSKGLCLVPVACTVHVANSNGADFWAPAMGSNVSSPAGAPASVTINEKKQKEMTFFWAYACV